jgi:hypothetical protein
MPTTYASQFTRFKRVVSIQKADTQASDSKSVNRLSQYTGRLTEIFALTSFVDTPTLKSAQPLTQVPAGLLGKVKLLHQSCS